MIAAPEPYSVTTPITLMLISRLLTALVAVALVAPAGAQATVINGSLLSQLDVETRNGAATATINAEVGADGDTATSSDTDSDASATTRTDLRVNALGIAVMTSAQVESDADLEVMSENMRVENESFAGAETKSDGKVSVEYYHNGHLFGLFPVKVKSHTTVEEDADGEVVVTTRMPWWNFFVTGTGNVAADVDSELSGSSASLESNFSASAEASARARIIEAVASAHAEVAAELQASANTQ